MDTTCRFCLNISDEITIKIRNGHDILKKLSECFSIDIPLNDFLPDKGCASCINKINDVHDFYTKIIDNEHKLQQYLTEKEEICKKSEIDEECNVQDFYENNDTLINCAEIKQEIIDNVSSFPEIKTEFDFHCSLCLRSFETPSLLLDHRTNCSNKINTQCDQHNNTNKTEDSATNILKEKDEKQMNIKNESDKYIVTKNENGINFKCNFCGKCFSMKKAIVRHVVCHTNERPFVCNLCGKTYKTSNEIIRHKRIHNSKELICSYKCGYRTLYRGALKTHEKNHQEPQHNYKCETCGKGFQVLTWYEQHQNIHKGLKPFVCNICGVAFHMERYLKAHLQNVHNNSGNDKRYVCIHCCLPMNSLQEMKQHKAEKHGLRTTCLCDICGKVFKNSERLKNHKIIHSTFKPHACGVCQKTFSKKFHLQEHEKTHTGERKHTCTVCSQSFVQRSSLLRHNRRRHPELKTNVER